MTFASSETQGESVGSRKTAAKLFKAWRESPKSPWDVGCDLPRVHSRDWRLAIGDCVWAQKLCAIRWADSLRLRLCPIGGQHLLHGFRDLVIRSSCKLDCSPCAICHEFIRMRVSSDWEQIVATATVLNRGPASVARLYEVGANSTVHRAHELTFDQFTVRILRLVHFLFSFILEQLQNTGPYFQVLNRSGSVAR